MPIVELKDVPQITALGMLRMIKERDELPIWEKGFQAGSDLVLCALDKWWADIAIDTLVEHKERLKQEFLSGC